MVRVPVLSQEERNYLMYRGMEIWRVESEAYRTLVYRYKFLLEERRAAKVPQMHPVSASVLRDYPEIPFLRVVSEAEAYEMLEQLSDRELRRLIRQLDDLLVTDFAYRTLKGRVVEFEYWARTRGQRSKFGLDPDYRGPGRRTRHHFGSDGSED